MNTDIEEGFASGSSPEPEPDRDGSVPGRWTLTVDLDGELVDDGTTHPGDHSIPAVPCDEAAVERAARALGANAGIIVAWDGRSEASQNYLRSCARAALRAAGEQA